MVARRTSCCWYAISQIRGKIGKLASRGIDLQMKHENAAKNAVELHHSMRWDDLLAGQSISISRDGYVGTGRFIETCYLYTGARDCS